MAGGETDVVDIFVVDTGIFRGHSFHDLSIPPNKKKKSQRKFNHQCPWVYSRLHRWFKSNGKVFGGFEKIELLDTIILGKTQSKQAPASNNKQEQATTKPRTMVKVSNVRVTLASVQDNAS